MPCHHTISLWVSRPPGPGLFLPPLMVHASVVSVVSCRCCCSGVACHSAGDRGPYDRRVLHVGLPLHVRCRHLLHRQRTALLLPLGGRPGEGDGTVRGTRSEEEEAEEARA